MRSETHGIVRARGRESQEGLSMGLGSHDIEKARNTRKGQRTKSLMTGDRDKEKADQRLGLGGTSMNLVC